MKTYVLLLAITVAVVYIKGETCPSGHTTDCRLTVCTGSGWVLNCVDNVCTCTHNEGGSHVTCTANDDCAGQGRDCPNNQHWRCLRGECHCTHQN
ncbi:hypothetical protein ACJMK2_023788 [Sinanodonta woodiana]|uniref:Uncharacterized protein n=1 Tax=Sinanodonta woodiana TaxID=1069815 RepID=A0ABD3T5U4_SINWO